MPSPRIKVRLNKGAQGVSLLVLGAVAKETVAFLTKLSVDLDDPESAANWMADDFTNNSVMFDVHRSRANRSSESVWRRGLRAVFSNDYSDAEMNVRVTPETRSQFWRITEPLIGREKIQFGLESEGEEPMEWFEIDKESALQAKEQQPEFYESYGEIQGVVHFLF